MSETDTPKYNSIAEAQQETIRILYRQLASEYPIVFAVRCCGRTYLGKNPAAKCRTCDAVPTNVELRSEVDLDSLLGTSGVSSGT